MKRGLQAIIVLLLVSCSPDVVPEQYLRPLGINLTGDYTVISKDRSPAIGDLVVDFELKLGPRDYAKVLTQIRNHSTFRKLDSLEHYPFGQYNNPWNEKKHYSCLRGKTYYRHLYLPDTVGVKGGWETYTLYLKSDSTLIFQYGQE